MAKITTPVKGFTGTVARVAFVNGEGETADPAALAYFARHGYSIEQADESVAVPEGKPSTDWKVDQLKAYAAEHSVDLGSAKTKPEIIAALELAAAAADSTGDRSTSAE